MMLESEEEKKVRESADKCCRLRYQGNTHEDPIEMSRMAAGLLPNEVVGKLRDVVSGESALRLSVYSAHDNTVMALLAHMGYRDWEVMLNNHDFFTTFTGIVRINV